jgi:hypothetical protein
VLGGSKNSDVLIPFRRSPFPPQPWAGPALGPPPPSTRGIRWRGAKARRPALDPVEGAKSGDLQEAALALVPPHAPWRRAAAMRGRELAEAEEGRAATRGTARSASLGPEVQAGAGVGDPRSSARLPSLPTTCAPGTEARRGAQGRRSKDWAMEQEVVEHAGGRNEVVDAPGRRSRRRRRPIRVGPAGGWDGERPRRPPPPPPKNALELWPCCKMQHMLQHRLEPKQCSPDLHFADADCDRAIAGDSLIL